MPQKLKVRKKKVQEREWPIGDHYACRITLHLEQVTTFSTKPRAPHISHRSSCKE